MAGFFGVKLMEINSNNFISRFHHFSGVFCFALLDFFRGDLLCLSFWGWLLTKKYIVETGTGIWKLYLFGGFG